MTPERRTIAYVADKADVPELARAAQLREEALDEIVVDTGDDDALDALQDAVYAGAVGRIIIPSLGLLGPDLMAQEMILAGWLERGVAVFSRDEPDLGADDPARRDVRAVLGEIDDYGKVPWVP